MSDLGEVTLGEVALIEAALSEGPLTDDTCCAKRNGAIIRASLAIVFGEVADFNL
jgi:hypothetical protein